MNTSEMPQNIGNVKSAPRQDVKPKKQEYTLNESLLMLNSALKFVGQHGIRMTLQRTEAGVVLTLHGLGIMQKENGATRIVPIDDTTPNANPQNTIP